MKKKLVLSILLLSSVAQAAEVCNVVLCNRIEGVDPYGIAMCSDATVSKKDAVKGKELDRTNKGLDAGYYVTRIVRVDNCYKEMK